MGKDTSSRDAYIKAVAENVRPGQAATRRGEEEVRSTGKLNKLVDPAEYGVIRESRIRLTERSDGLFEVTIGAPYPIEYRLDTTGSMGRNVDDALCVLPHICEGVEAVLPGRDPFYCASIFNDCEDRDGQGFPYCRGQFECLSDRMVKQLTSMNPQREGCGNGGEDSQYGLFASAFLTSAWFRRAGLRSYDFTLTDEPAHESVDPTWLCRIFGNQIFEKLRVNGHEFSPGNLPSNEQIVEELIKSAHAFALIINDNQRTTSYWRDLLGRNRVVALPNMEASPHVIATIIGLTEGTFRLDRAVDFLVNREVARDRARRIVDAVAHIPIGAQCALPNFSRLPKKGDLYRNKTDLWPIDPSEVPTGSAKKGKKPKAESDEGDAGGWL